MFSICIPCPLEITTRLWSQLREGSATSLPIVETNDGDVTSYIPLLSFVLGLRLGSL